MKKSISVALIVLMLSFLFSSCNEEKKPATKEENTLYIQILERGYGSAFLEKLKEGFESENPGKKVVIEKTIIAAKMDLALRDGPKKTKTDLFFTVADIYSIIGQASSYIKEYPMILEDLSDVYASAPKGENMTVKDKMYKDYESYYNIDGKYYSFPWAASMSGLIYNPQMLKSVGFDKTPRTSEELVELAQALKDNGKEAFMYPGSYDFWKFVYQIWWAQYEGNTSFNNFWAGKDEKGKYSDTIFLQQGRLEALEALYKLIKKENGYSNKLVNETEFGTAQASFITGKQAMMPNGDWLENEEKSSKDSAVKISFMKTPVISTLAKKLSITEAQLRNAVDYADGITKTKPNDISQAVLDEVKKARDLMFTIGQTHIVFMPVYSDAKDLGKSFLKYMASDKGIKDYAITMNSASMPFKFDYKSGSNKAIYDNMTDFQKSKLDLMTTSSFVFENFSSPIFYKAGLKPFSIEKGSVEIVLGAGNSSNIFKTPKQIFDYEYNYNKGDKFMNRLRDAGILKG